MKHLWGYVIFTEKEYDDRENIITYNFNKAITERHQLGEQARAWHDECFKTRQDLRACSDCADDAANMAAKRAQSLADELQASLVNAMVHATSSFPCPMKKVKP